MSYETMAARVRSANSVTVFVTVFAHGVLSAFGELIAGVRRHLERRRAYEQVLAMTDAQLKDIGLTRAEIHARVFAKRER